MTQRREILTWQDVDQLIDRLLGRTDSAGKYHIRGLGYILDLDKAVEHFKDMGWIFGPPFSAQVDLAQAAPAISNQESVDRLAG